MTERGMNHFVRAIILFARSLRPSYLRNYNKSSLVGQDHLGNKYFEIPADPSRGKRNPQRYFKPQGVEMDNWDQPIPPEWNAWLRLQRPDPPSEEEMKYKLDRMATIEARKNQNPPEKITVSKDQSSSFPKYPEYEENPGSKYKL